MKWQCIVSLYFCLQEAAQEEPRLLSFSSKGQQFEEGKGAGRQQGLQELAAPQQLEPVSVTFHVPRQVHVLYWDISQVCSAHLAKISTKRVNTDVQAISFADVTRFVSVRK